MPSERVDEQKGQFFRKYKIGSNDEFLTAYFASYPKATPQMALTALRAFARSKDPDSSSGRTAELLASYPD